jgi:CO/xanthine dehydrogenase Mo-binding subunit
VDDNRTLADLRPKPSQREYGKGYRLIGKDYNTADMLAKVTGRAKYAEDFRAEGMLFCRLVLSPLPHARVRSIDTSAAITVPGVKAILMADDIPVPADSKDDNGNAVKASKWRELALTNEPMYVGDPILAVAAVDELACAEAIEKIEIDFESLPWVLDPLESLRPGGHNPREDGNTWVSQPSNPQTPQLREVKWTEADFAEYNSGRLPMGNVPDQWSYGDLDEGFKNAALILDETFVSPDTCHQCLEPRTAMAYWQNGKLFLHTGTQSTGQTLSLIAQLMDMPQENVVFISEYTGGGFGGKVRAGVTMIVPALLSKKLGVPVMMRISREEEHFIGRARTGVQGRFKVGFAGDGKIVALDMFTVSNSGSYDAQFDGLWSAKFVSLLYQPRAMRQRAISVMTNTPPRMPQTSPGGLVCSVMMEPILSKAARRLGIDQLTIRRVNCPVGKAEFGPLVKGTRSHATSCFLREALDRGAEQFRWNERIKRGQAIGHEGARSWSRSVRARWRRDRLRRIAGDHAGGASAVPVGHCQPWNRVGIRCVSRGGGEAWRAVGDLRHHMGRYVEESSLFVLCGRQQNNKRDDPCILGVGGRVRAATEGGCGEDLWRRCRRLPGGRSARIPQRRRRGTELCGSSEAGDRFGRYLRRSRSES